MAADSTTTVPASDLAAYSLTGLGNVSSPIATRTATTPVAGYSAAPVGPMARKPAGPVSRASIRSSLRCSAAISA